MMSELAFAVKSVQTPDFRTMVEAEIPGLRRYARALIRRDVSAADDLVQDTLTRGLLKQHLWVEGTSLRAWLFTIMHNQYVNIVRRAVREGAVVVVSETEPSLTCVPSQEKVLELRDLNRALGQISGEQRAVILLVGLEGLPYDEVAEIIGVPVGTVRSRLSRGREALRQLVGSVPDRHAAAGCPLVTAATIERAGDAFVDRIGRGSHSGIPVDNRAM
jgi:RNA polymerase sigma-70 factor (ECF subfamily)